MSLAADPVIRIETVSGVDMFTVSDPASRTDLSYPLDQIEGLICEHIRQKRRADRPTWVASESKGGAA